LRVVNTNLIDGVKLLLEDDAWVLVRPSGTEPLIRCYIEAHDEPTLGGLKAAMQQLVG
jgi:phosphomannomutase